MFDISTPKKRERFLLILAGVILVIVVVPVLQSLFGNEVAGLRIQRKKFQDDITKYQNEAKNEAEIKKRLADLTSRSLPARDDALSQYQNWLQRLATETGIRGYSSEAGTSSLKKNLYTQYTVTIKGKGSLEQISEFLRQFHKTPYLHLIRSFSPRPTKVPNEYEISVKVEALSVPQNRSSRELPEFDKNLLALTEEDKKMMQVIKERSVLSEYTPPKPAPVNASPTKMDDIDSAQYCYVTAILEVDEKCQCWITNRIEDKTYKLFEGETFQLGGVHCIVKKIDFDKKDIQVEARTQVDVKGDIYTIREGKTFADAE